MTTILAQLPDGFDNFSITVNTVTALDDPGDCQYCDTEGATVEAQAYFTRHDEDGRRFFDGCMHCVRTVVNRDADIEFAVTIEVAA